MGKVRDKDKDRHKNGAKDKRKTGTEDKDGAGDGVGAASGPADAEPGRAADAVEQIRAPTRNEVVLVGRVGAAAELRTLPSGDELVVWRVVVDRPFDGRPPREGARAVLVDTIDCTAWEQSVRRVAGELGPGDLVALEGSLRRRFWRGAQGPSSRYEVEVTALQRLAPTAG